MAVSGASGRLRRWGIQGLSPDELGIEPTFPQELFMGPRLEKKEGQTVTQPRAQDPGRAGFVSAIGLAVT